MTTTKATTKATTLKTNFDKSIATRIKAVESEARSDKSKDATVSKYKVCMNRLNHACFEYLESNKFDTNALIKKIAITDKRDQDFIALYALEKITKMIAALAQKIESSLDKYSLTIVKNLLKSENKQSFDNKSSLVALSREIVFSETDTQKAISTRHNCSASTASTQMSSTRMMLAHLQLCTVKKRAFNDLFVVDTESKLLNDFVQLFSK